MPVFQCGVRDGQSILFSGCSKGEEPMPACSDWWVTSADGKALVNTHLLAELNSEQITPWDGILDGWYGNRVLFSGRKGSQTSLWMIKLSPKDFTTIGGSRTIDDGRSQGHDAITGRKWDGCLHPPPGSAPPLADRQCFASRRSDTFQSNGRSRRRRIPVCLHKWTVGGLFKGLGQSSRCVDQGHPLRY